MIYQDKDLTLAVYAQEKQAIQYHRIAERNQLVMALFLIVAATAYYIHLHNPEFDPFTFISVVLVFSVTAVFSIWVSHQSSLRSCNFVDQIEAEMELPGHLRKDSWIWSYTLRAKWNVIVKFLLVLVISLLSIYLSGLFERQAKVEQAFLNEFNTHQKLSTEDLLMKMDRARRTYQRNEIISFMNKMAAMVVGLFLLVVAFHLGKMIGYNASKLEHKAEHGGEHDHHEDHHHGPIPVPDLDKENNQKYQNLEEIRERVAALEKDMNKVTVF